MRKLRAVGYRPRLQTFSFDFFRETKPPVLERVKPVNRRYRKGPDFLVMRYSGGGNLTARVVPVHSTSASSGCSASDFGGFPNGAIALMKRGDCPFTQKARNAEAAGAAAALIANDGTPGRTAPLMATLFTTVRIPVLIVSSAVAADLGPSSTVHIELSVSTRTARAASVIADLPGRQSGVVLLGGHLDSVASGPGINDNGSGSALVLEVARQARRLHVRPRHGLRFAFWGGEELGLLGSRSYVQSLSGRQRSQILDVLNFDMVGSPNFGRIVYTGDGAPQGSVRIENAFRAYFAARRLPVEEESLGGASDHAAFADAGIPVGGLFTGADEPKSAAHGQALRRPGGDVVRRLLPQGVRLGRERRLRHPRPDGRCGRRRRSAPRRLAADEPPRGDERPHSLKQEEAPLPLVPGHDREHERTQEVEPQVRPRAHIEDAALSRDEGGEDRERAEDLDELAHRLPSTVTRARC